MTLPGGSCPAATPIDDGRWVTEKRHGTLAPHPRLFVSAEQIRRMVERGNLSDDGNYEQVARAAETGLRDADDPMRGVGAHQRGFWIIGRLTSMATMWHRTGDRRYIEFALKHLQAMKKWLPVNGNIQLWEGQFITSVAVLYDMLHDDLTDEEREFMVDFARDHCIRSFLKVSAPADPKLRIPGEGRTWWMGVVSNWNPVCLSGVGMLALTMYEDIEEAQTVIDRVNGSLQPIFDYLQKSEGGWVEGLGYWNWTMHYTSLFCLSYERSTGREHEGFRSPGFRETLLFGQYFNPYDEQCGFGDNQHGGISSSLFQAAERLGHRDVLRRLQDYNGFREELRERRAGKKPRKPARKESEGEYKPLNVGYWTPYSLYLKPDPVRDVEPATVGTGLAHFYPRQGWGVLADKWPEPSVYVSMRGGELGGAHTHRDLLSWNAVVGTEKMIHNIVRAGYYDSAFYRREHEIYERHQASKNTLFIAGLSAYPGTQGPRHRQIQPRADMSRLDLPAGPAIRLEATDAFYFANRPRNPRFVGRLFALLGDKGVLVLDRVEMPGRNPVEARVHTTKQAEFGESDVLLTGKHASARVTFASDRRAVLRRASALTTEGRTTPPTMMRYMTRSSESKVTLACLLTEGEDKVELEVRTEGGLVVVSATAADWQSSVTVTTRLESPER